MQKALNECRENFGFPGRTFSFWERLFYLRIKCPRWCDEDDGLYTFFRHKDRLLENGEVVWGHVVQANRLLFSLFTFFTLRLLLFFLLLYMLLLFHIFLSSNCYTQRVLFFFLVVSL